jgi:hypothetical protein
VNRRGIGSTILDDSTTKETDMCRRISKLSGVRRSKKKDMVGPLDSVRVSASDRAFVLDIFADLARAGLGVLEEIPDLGSQFFTFRSGEVFWLRAKEITRIR